MTSVFIILVITGTSATASKLTMHHISTCDQCGRPQKGKTGSWCELPPNCTAFEFDDNHLEGPPLSAVGCDKLPSCGRATSLHGGKVAVTYCLKGGYSLFAATDPSVPPPSNCPAPAPPPKIVPPIWHLPARCEEGDVNALFQVFKGNVCAHYYLPLSLQVGNFLLQLLGTHKYVCRVICLVIGFVMSLPISLQWEGQWHLMQQWHARPATSVGHAVILVTRIGAFIYIYIYISTNTHSAPFFFF